MKTRWAYFWWWFKWCFLGPYPSRSYRAWRQWEKEKSVTKQEDRTKGLRDILRRYGDFIDGNDTGDVLDIDEALECIEKVVQPRKAKKERR